MPIVPKERDAYDAELLACEKLDNDVEIAERDDGYIDPSFGSSPCLWTYKNWLSIEKKAIRLVRGLARSTWDAKREGSVATCRRRATRSSASTTHQAQFASAKGEKSGMHS